MKHFAKLERFGELFFVQPEYRCQVAKPLIKIYRINKIYNSRVKKTDCRILWQFIASSTVKAPEFGRYHVPLTHSRREFTHVSHGRRLIPFAALLIAARTAQWPNMVKFPSKNMQSVKIVGKYVDITTSHYFSLYGYVFFSLWVKNKGKPSKKVYSPTLGYWRIQLVNGFLISDEAQRGWWTVLDVFCTLHRVPICVWNLVGFETGRETQSDGRRCIFIFTIFCWPCHDLT